MTWRPLRGLGGLLAILLAGHQLDWLHSFAVIRNPPAPTGVPSSVGMRMPRFALMG